MVMCLHLLVVLFFATVQPEVLDHRFFLAQIIETYGYNGTISYEGFERLYNNLGLGNSTDYAAKTDSKPAVMSLNIETATSSRTSREIGSYNTSTECKSKAELTELVLQHNEVSPKSISSTLPRKHCLSLRELLVVYGLPEHSGTLTPVNFLHLCPAIIYELDQRTCVKRVEHGERHEYIVSGDSTSSSWLFASLTILVISVSGLVSVALVPLLHKSFVTQIISFLVALAVGTLLGDAFLHLIPHALEAHEPHSEHSHTESVMKTSLMFLTVVFFFTFEAVLNAFRIKKADQRVLDNLNYTSVNINPTEKEMMELGKEHHHSHSPQNNTALMVIMGDGLHNLTDGLAIGAAFSGGLAPGFATAVAVFTHELPHELGDFAVLLQSGMTVPKALLYNLLSSILSLLGTVVGLTVGNFGASTQWIYAITAGSFIYIALSNLVPEITKQKCSGRTIILHLSGILCGGALMGCIALFEDDIHKLFL